MPFQRNTGISQHYKRKELSRYRILQRKRKRASFMLPGSLTVEAAMVLPLFVMVVTGLLSLFYILIFQLRLQGIMDTAAQKAAAYSYAVSLVQEDGEKAEEARHAGGIGKELLTGGITAVYLKTQIVSQLDDRLVEMAGVIGGKAGLLLLQSRFPDDTGAIDLVVSYEIRIPFLPQAAGRLSMSQRSRRMAWTGSRRWKDTGGDTEEELVYVTEYGTVYHRDLNCSHLQLSIRAVFPVDVEKERNSSGEKYDPCERCAGGIIGYQVYITDDGDRYHALLHCPGLTRRIRRVPLSEAKGLPACKRCGQ